MQQNYKINIIKVNDLKNNFISFVNLRDIIKSIFDNIELKINKLKAIYTEFINNNNNNVYAFSLDSLYFQVKLVDTELYQLNQYYKLINNKIYSSYYKLYKIITIYLKKTFTDTKILKIINSNISFQIYKDLEPYKDYNFEHTIILHNTIIEIIIAINDYLNIKNIELINYENTKNNGFNINNFINTFDHVNILIIMETELYIKYLDFLYNLHYNYYTRFIDKIKILKNQIEQDIIFNNRNPIIEPAIIEPIKEIIEPAIIEPAIIEPEIIEPEIIEPEIIEQIKEIIEPEIIEPEIIEPEIIEQIIEQIKEIIEQIKEPIEIIEPETIEPIEPDHINSL